MGEVKRRRAGLTAVPHQPGQVMAPKPVLCNVIPGPAVEQTGPDGTVYHVQGFHLANARGEPLGLRTADGFVPFLFTAAPIPIRKTVLVASGAQVARG